MKKFKADPHVVALRGDNEEAIAFANVLKAVAQKPVTATPQTAGDSRWGEYGTSYIVMDNLRDGEPMVGSVFMARNDDLPSVGGISGISPPPLSSDQGMGKHVAFLWDESAGILWFQRDRGSVGLGAFRDYLMAKTGVSIAITPCVSPDALRKAGKLKYLRRIDVTFSTAPGDEAFDPPRGTSVADFIKLRERLDAATISVSIKPGRNKYLGKGSNGFVQEAVTMIREGFGPLRRARVVGIVKFDENNDADWETVDLLRDKLHFEVPLEPRRFRDAAALMDAIKRLWRDFRDSV